MNEQQELPVGVRRLADARTLNSEQLLSRAAAGTAVGVLRVHLPMTLKAAPVKLVCGARKRVRLRHKRGRVALPDVPLRRLPVAS
jgi:hypothetical protein